MNKRIHFCQIRNIWRTATETHIQHFITINYVTLPIFINFLLYFAMYITRIGTLEI